ncbi:ATP-binding protein [Bradyrhizobium sp.]|uniref:ATP-binding protein n=1 Tax=Bradyrhizobium sp. TaxID=376 RepID=UPI003C4CF63C
MIAVPVQDQTQVAEARRRAVAVAERHGFAAAESGRVALVATELSTNLLKHGRGGELLIGAFEEHGTSGIELIALDKGPGMVNVEACLEDGYSSAGTAGKGLGAVIRQSQLTDIASWPGLGTAILVRLEAGGQSGRQDRPFARVGAIAVPMRGEEVCGDSWSVAYPPSGPTLLVADGLGHGPQAAEASVEAVRLFHRFQGHQVPTLLDYVHGGLRATRGAAVSIARLDSAAGKVVFAGIGNVAGVIIAGGEMRRMVSMPGTAGHVARKIQSFDYPFKSGLVILHSDGLLSSWTLERYPNITARHPTLIAAVLYRDLARGRDDVSVLVAKW